MANEKVFNLVKEKRSLYASIKRRRNRFIEHTLRDKRQIEDDIGCSGYCEMKRVGTDKELHQTTLRTADYSDNNKFRHKIDAIIIGENMNERMVQEY